MAVIIEVKEPNTKGIHRYSLNHNEFSLGRGYDNDVIIDDPYSDIHHAIIKNDGNAFQVKDCSNLNGIQNEKRQELGEISLISSGDRITIGHTQIRVLDPEHPLPKTLPLRNANSFTSMSLKALENIWTCLCLVGILWLIELDRIYLASDRQEDVTQYFSSSIEDIIGILLIAGIMSFIGKVALKEWHFLRNLSGLSLILILVWLIEIPKEAMAFSLNFAETLWLAELATVAFTVGILTVVFLSNLPRFKPIYQTLVVCCITVATMTYLVVSEQENNERNKHYYPVISEVFSPMQLPFANVITEQEFLEESQIVFEKLNAHFSEP